MNVVSKSRQWCVQSRSLYRYRYLSAVMRVRVSSSNGCSGNTISQSKHENPIFTLKIFPLSIKERLPGSLGIFCTGCLSGNSAGKFRFRSDDKAGLAQTSEAKIGCSCV
jgi:hypothetical protein